MAKTFSGEKLIVLRRARGMSRTELATAVGRQFDAIGTWERGHCDPHLASFYALLEVLGCEADDLLNDNEAASVGRPPRVTAVSLGSLDGAGRRTHERS